MWVYFEIDWTNLGFYAIYWCKYSYNEINVKIVGPQGPRFSEEDPNIKF